MSLRSIQWFDLICATCVCHCCPSPPPALSTEAAKPPAEGQGQQQEQQKQKGRQRTPNTAAALNGMLNSKVGQLQKALTGNGVNALERTHFLPALPEGGQEASPEVWQQWVAEAVESVARWAGAGTQLQAAPPTYACCFTTIPGEGQGVFCSGIQVTELSRHPGSL